MNRSTALRQWLLICGVAFGLMGLQEPAWSASDSAAAWMGVESAQFRLVAEPVYGGQVAVYSAGDPKNPPLVLIHGLGTNGAKDWANVVPELARRFHVIAIDQPGFGASSRGNHLYSPENQARVLDALLRKLGVGEHILIGHSFGAAVALAYAGEHNQRVRRLILVDMAGVLHRSVYTEYLSRMGALYFTGIYPQENSLFGGLIREALRTAERWAADAGWALESPWFRQQVLQGDANAIAAYALVEHDFSATLDRLAMPTLLIWGRDDPLAPLRTGQAVASRVNHARLSVLDGIGHSPMFESPEQFRQLLLHELNDYSPGETLRWSPAPGSTAREARCTGLERAHFTGVISVLQLENCTEVRVERASIGRIEARNSRVRLIDASVRDSARIQGGFLQMTGGRLDGPVALHSANADLAGVELGPTAQMQAHGPHRVAVHFSVSRRQLRTSQANAEYLHGTRELAPGEFW